MLYECIMNDFFLFEEKVSSSRNFDFCVFDDSTKQKIFDVIINIFAHQMFHFIMKSETIIIKISDQIRGQSLR